MGEDGEGVNALLVQGLVFGSVGHRVNTRFNIHLLRSSTHTHHRGADRDSRGRKTRAREGHMGAEIDTKEIDEKLRRHYERLVHPLTVSASILSKSAGISRLSAPASLSLFTPLSRPAGELFGRKSRQPQRCTQGSKRADRGMTPGDRFTETETYKHTRTHAHKHSRRQTDTHTAWPWEDADGRYDSRNLIFSYILTLSARRVRVSSSSAPSRFLSAAFSASNAALAARNLRHGKALCQGAVLPSE